MASVGDELSDTGQQGLHLGLHVLYHSPQLLDGGVAILLQDTDPHTKIRQLLLEILFVVLQQPDLMNPLQTLNPQPKTPKP